MSNARERILSRLRKTPEGSLKAQPHSPTVNQRSRPILIEQFRTMIEAVHGQTVLVNEESWYDRLNQILADHKVQQLLIGAETWPGNSIKQRPPSGIDLVTYDTTSDSWKEQLFQQVDASVTSAYGAIAETGSIALWPSPEEPRLMSLVPPIHIVLLRAEQIFANFTEMLEEQEWAANMPSNALLISGPSKSADIEQVLAYGVHGPKSLIVLILQ